LNFHLSVADIGEMVGVAVWGAGVVLFCTRPRPVIWPLIFTVPKGPIA
jgi:hypothetical protein